MDETPTNRNSKGKLKKMLYTQFAKYKTWVFPCTTVRLMIFLPWSIFHSVINIFNSSWGSRFDLNWSSLLFMLFLLAVWLLQLPPVAQLALCAVSCLCWCFCAILALPHLHLLPPSLPGAAPHSLPLHLIPTSLLTLLFQLLEKKCVQPS